MVGGAAANRGNRVARVGRRDDTRGRVVGGQVGGGFRGERVEKGGIVRPEGRGRKGGGRGRVGAVGGREGGVVRYSGLRIIEWGQRRGWRGMASGARSIVFWVVPVSVVVARR